MPRLFSLGKKEPKGPPPLQGKDIILESLKKVKDPDLHKDIVSLGFVKDIQIKGATAEIKVELTTPACPAKYLLKKEIIEAASAASGLAIEVEFTARTRRGGTLNAEVENSLGQVKNVIAIASGKGGVAKSTTTVNLAYALAKSGSKVGILDADIYGPSIPKMTRVPNPEEAQGNMIIPPERDGVKVISVGLFGKKDAPHILRGPMTAQIIKQFLTQIAWGELDYLLIDYPPGTGDIQLSLSQLAPLAGAVIVTSPQEVALADVYKAISMFTTTKIPLIGVVESMSYFVCDGCDKKHWIFSQGGGDKLAHQFGIPLLAKTPLDPKLAEASDQGEPFVLKYPDHPTSQIFMEAAGGLASQCSILNMQNDLQLTSFQLDWQ